MRWPGLAEDCLLWLYHHDVSLRSINYLTVAHEVTRTSKKTACFDYAISGENLRSKNHLWWHTWCPGQAGRLPAGAIPSVVKVEDPRTLDQQRVAPLVARTSRNPTSSSSSPPFTTLYMNNSQKIMFYTDHL